MDVKLEELSRLNRVYLDQLSNPQNGDNHEEHLNNCSIFRVLLYTLRLQLLPYLKAKFEKFTTEQSLRGQVAACKVKILEEIRRPTQVSSGGQIQVLVNKAKDRKRLINGLGDEYFVADYCTLISCYSGTVTFQKFKSRKCLNVEDFDPKDLLEVLMNCKLFPEVLYPAAKAVVEDQNA
jgi:hypothetical protein